MQPDCLNLEAPEKITGMPLPPFDALPPRAKGDRRLQASHYAALLAVAFHDRFSQHNGGQGCWASVRTLARETGLHYVTVARAIQDLLAWGYLWERSVDNRRHLAVDYSEAVSPGANKGVSVQANRGVSPGANRSKPSKKPPKANSAEAVEGERAPSPIRAARERGQVLYLFGRKPPD
jgi:hypothetical protein